MKVFGGDGERETPLPIPNRVVKPLRADGTAWVTVWESRSPPSFYQPFGGNIEGLFVLLFSRWTRDREARTGETCPGFVFFLGRSCTARAIRSCRPVCREASYEEKVPTVGSESDVSSVFEEFFEL